MTSHKFFGTDGIRGKYGSQAMNRNLHILSALQLENIWRAKVKRAGP